MWSRCTSRKPTWRQRRRGRTQPSFWFDQASRPRLVDRWRMNAKNQKPNLSPEKIQSTSFLIWIISGMYLLPMVWFLLSTMVAHGAHETRPWLLPVVAALTVSYGILMLLLWPHEKVSPRLTSQSNPHPYAD